MKPPEGKKFYGSVTVGERGQIVIPADARKEFGFKAGDKLLVFADMEMGLWIATFDILRKTAEGAVGLFHEIESTMKHNENQESKTDDESKTTMP